ncbi:hypothetical protein FBU30_005536 [Linnemannia zychae]|nr:hypothetical protein FBU30_005536 [Linnemannia zychae]
MTADLRLSTSSNIYSGIISGNNPITNTHNSRGRYDDEDLCRKVEVMMAETTEENQGYEQPRIEIIETTDSIGLETERWDDAFELDAHQSLDHIFELLHRQCPQSPLSDSSDQSDYFQARPPLPPPPTLPSTTPLPLSRPSFSLPESLKGSPPTLPTPPLTTTTNHTLWNLQRKENPHLQKTKRLLGSTRSYKKVDSQPQSVSSPSIPINHTINSNIGTGSSLDGLPKGNSLSSSSLRRRSEGQNLYCATTPPTEAAKMSSLSPVSSASSSPRAITASVTAPSTVATSAGSLLSKYKSADGVDKDSPTLSTKSMTTITQEMMLSNLPAFTGIITRINPIKRVEAWVDDLEDLEVPEEDLNFNHVRSTLAKSASMPETLESIDSWDSSSERSLTPSDHGDTSAEGQIASSVPKAGTPLVLQHPLASSSLPFDPSESGANNQKSKVATDEEQGASDKIETMDDAFEIPDDFGSFRLHVSSRLQTHSGKLESKSYQQQLALSRWRDSGSDFDELDFGTPADSHSLSSSGSVSRESITEDDDNLLDGIEFPEDMEDLRLVTHHQYKVEMEPSIFGKESRLHEEQDDFWDGLVIDDDYVFNHKGRNKNVIVRPIIAGRERSSSRVQREIVPLKDFVALPSRIPRLCRGPTDTSRPVTPASSLSRAHSTYFDLPLRHTTSKSSLPRLKRNSISRRESTRTESPLPISGQSRPPGENIYTPPSPSEFIISSSSAALSSSRRNSALIHRDDYPNSKSNSLSMRTVSFTEPAQPTDLTAATPITTPVKGEASKPPVPTSSGKSFPGLRTLVRRLDFVRPRFSIRGQIPLFEAPSSVLPEPSSSQDLNKPQQEPAIQASDTNAVVDQLHQQQSPRPSISRSSSFTDFGSVINSTDAIRDSRSPSRLGALSLGEISEGEMTSSDFGEIASTSPVATGEKFSRRWFLKRSPKQSALSDGSELDRIDNLPTYGASEQQYQYSQLQNQQLVEKTQLQAMQMAAVAAAQGRRQSLDRVSAWLRKPQSIANLKENLKAEVRRADSDVSATKVQKAKSIRRSLFDIFVQNSSAEEPKQIEPVEKKDPSIKGKKSMAKKKPHSGPNLIRDLSQTKVRKVAGMVFHPDSKMWNGNDHILNEFDDDEDDNITNNPIYQQHTPDIASAAISGAYPSTPYSHQLPLSPGSPNSPSTNAMIRPALISNMNQHSKQRTQVAGKMIFDPNRMCWIINPEYLSRKRQKRYGDQYHLHTRQLSLDDTWGDEPDVFAGMSDSDNDTDDEEDNKEPEEQQYESNSIVAVATTGATTVPASANSSLERSKGRRLISRPSFKRMSSHDYMADEERLQAWAEPTRSAISDAAHGGGADSRPHSMNVHSIVSKSSRRSLNMLGSCSNGLFVGGGYSSQGEFEVGVEFDITDDFLEQCMATESQHRKDAGRFFGLPCTPVATKTGTPRQRAPRKMPSKMFNKLIKPSNSNSANGKEKTEIKLKGKEHRKLGKDIETPSASSENKKEVILPYLEPLPLLSWPRRTKSKSVVLQSPILDCIGLPSPPETQRAATIKVQSFQTEKGFHINPSNKFKSLTLGRVGLFSNTAASTHTPISSLFHRIPTGGKEKETVAPNDLPPAAVSPRVRKGSRDLFFSQRLSSKKSQSPTSNDRGTLTFAATFAIARKGNAYDRRRISAQTFHPLAGTGPNMDNNGKSEEWAIRKERRFAMDADSGIDSDDMAEDEDDCDRGYRKMPVSRGRPPRRTRNELIMEFAQHTGPGFRF